MLLKDKIKIADSEKIVDTAYKNSVIDTVKSTIKKDYRGQLLSPILYCPSYLQYSTALSSWSFNGFQQYNIFTVHVTV